MIKSMLIFIAIIFFQNIASMQIRIASTGETPCSGKLFSESIFSDTFHFVYYNDLLKNYFAKDLQKYISINKKKYTKIPITLFTDTSIDFSNDKNIEVLIETKDTLILNSSEMEIFEKNTLGDIFNNKPFFGNFKNSEKISIKRINSILLNINGNKIIMALGR
jgi:hypothetical protein